MGERVFTFNQIGRVFLPINVLFGYEAHNTLV